MPNKPRRPCTRCGTKTASVRQLCGDHRPKVETKRPERQCSIRGCDHVTRSKTGVCRACSLLTNAGWGTSKVDTKDDVVELIQWRRRGLILVPVLAEPAQRSA